MLFSSDSKSIAFLLYIPWITSLTLILSVYYVDRTCRENAIMTEYFVLGSLFYVFFNSFVKVDQQRMKKLIAFFSTHKDLLS